VLLSCRTQGKPGNTFIVIIILLLLLLLLAQEQQAYSTFPMCPVFQSSMLLSEFFLPQEMAILLIIVTLTTPLWKWLLVATLLWHYNSSSLKVSLNRYKHFGYRYFLHNIKGY
jgi:hypothetical protein